MANLFDAVNFSIMSLKDFQDKELAYNVMHTIAMLGDDFFPTVYDVYEPLKHKCNQSDIDALVRMWMNEDSALTNSQNDYAMGRLLMGKRKKHKVNYLIHWEKSQQERFNYFVLRVDSSYLKTETGFQKFMDLCKRLIILLEPVQGEIVNLAFPGWDTPINLQVRYPELHWMSFFGAPYITLFGRENLLATPCHHVQTVGENVIALQVGENLFSPVTKEARSAVKEHLNPCAFVEEGKSYLAYKTGAVPLFDFSNVLFDKTKPVIHPQIRMNRPLVYQSKIALYNATHRYNRHRRPSIFYGGLTMKQHITVKLLDGISIGLIILWLIGYGTHIISQPFGLILIGIPFILSAISVVINLRSAKADRVAAYRLGYMSYWHPYCTISIIISLFLIILPGTGVVFRILHILGVIGVLLVVIWSFFQWIKAG